MKWLSLIKIIWQYMDGKKTNTGTITMIVGLAGVLLPMFGIEVDQEKLLAVITWIVSSGVLVAIGGLIHKFLKKE